MKRGNEPLEHPIWDTRIPELVKELEKQPMTAIEICKHFSKKKKWGATYTINVLASADIKGYVECLEDVWMVAV